MVESKDQRRAERHRVRFHLVYDDGGSFNAGNVRDLSETGLFLETALALPVGTILTLTALDAAGVGVPEVRAQVARSIPYDPETNLQQPAGMGLQFIDLNPEERKAVVSMIRRLEDEAAQNPSEVDPFLGVRVRTRPSIPTSPKT